MALRPLSQMKIYQEDKKNAVATIPEFRTQRLFMRGIRLQDAVFYQKHFAHWAIIQYLSPSCPWPYPVGEAARFLKTEIFPRQGSDLWMWALFLKHKPDELIGALELRRKGKPGDPGQRGFWLAQHLWRKGLMSEAVIPVLDYAFGPLGFEFLIFSNAVSNTASRRIKEKTHCRFIGYRPQKFANPKFTKSEIWELKKKDWIDSRK